MRNDLVKISKYLSLILRHKPETIGLSLDSEGWIEINKLIRACETSGVKITVEELYEVVEQNEKKRFVIRDGRIRASQGHSLDVNLGLEPIKPPKYLYPQLRNMGLNERIAYWYICRMMRKQHEWLALAMGSLLF